MSDAADDRYRTLFNLTGLGVLFTDADGRIVEANPAALRMLGASDADLGRLPARPPFIQTLREDGTPFPEEDRPALAALASGQPVRDVILGIVNPAAEARWVSIDSYPVFAGSETAPARVMTTIRDITKEKEARDALRSSETLFRDLVTHLDVGLIAASPDGRSLTWNPAALRLHGLSPDEGHLNQLDKALEVFGVYTTEGEPLPAHQLPLMRLARGESFEDWELNIRRRDAKWNRIISYSGTIIRDADGTIAMVLLSARDVTERRAQNERAARWGLFFEQTGIALAISDPVTNTFSDVNTTFARQRGYSREDLIGRPVLSVFAPEAVEDMRRRLPELDRVGHLALETVHLHRDGFRIPIRLEVTVIRDAAGKPVSRVAHAVDLTDIRRSSEAALLAETRLQRAATAGRVGLWDWDLATNEVHFSPEWKRQIGFEPHELTETFSTWRDRIHPDDADAAVAYVRAYLERPEGPFNNEFRFRHKDGSYRRILAQASVDRDDTGKATRLFGSHVDITDLRTAEEHSRTNERVLRSLFNAIPESVFLMATDGTVLAANDTFAARMGCTVAECLGKSVLSMIPEPIRDRRRQWIVEVVATGRPVVYEDERQDLWLEHHLYPIVGRDGTVDRIVVFAVDTTARRRMEQDLHDSQQRFAHLIETTFDWVWEIDRNGRYVYSNDRVTQLLGYAPNEVLGKTPFDLMPSGEAQRVRPLFMSLAAEHAPLNTIENVCRHKNGSLVVVETSGVPLVGPQGEYLGYRGMDRDVTGRRRLEEQLRQAQKLEAVGQLAGGVAHDFNNILAAIMMHLGLLQTSPELNDQTRHALGELEAEARRAAGLTRQLLMFSRRSVLDVRTLQLNDIIANLLKMLRRLIGEHVDLRFDAKADLPPIEADAGMVEQVLVNLVVNARDSMPRGGRVTLSTGVEHVDQERVALHADRRVGTYVRVSVIDSGCGMDSATVARIFEPFFSTKAPGRGTGLGLATVHGIIAQHHGWVEVSSTPGIGTTFDVYLPALPGAKVTEDLQATPPPLARGRETVLVVEDEAGVRRMIALTLASQGYHVLEAVNGRDALRVWQDRGAEVDLLFTDMVMPEGVSGLELAERLKELKPGLRIIISSGYSQEVVQAGVPSRPGLLYLPKPYDSRTLATTVRSFLDQKPS
jgi:PAS domain S-box-containing protein